MPRLAWFAAGSIVAALASPAVAQLLPAPQFTPVDPVVEDVDSLSISLRTLELGLQQPVEFRRVFRMKGLEDQFVRVHGGLYAVFPHSVYAPSRQGAVPLVPAGTVFHIGDPTGEAYRPGNGPLDPPTAITGEPMAMRLDMRIVVEPEPPLRESQRPRDQFVKRESAPGDRFMQAEPAPPASAAPLEAPGTMFGDEAYRGPRMLELLLRAADAEKDGPLP